MKVKCNECRQEFVATNGQIEAAKVDNIYICTGCVDNFMTDDDAELVMKAIKEAYTICKTENKPIPFEDVPTDGTIN